MVVGIKKNEQNTIKKLETNASKIYQLFQASYARIKTEPISQNA